MTRHQNAALGITLGMIFGGGLLLALSIPSSRSTDCVVYQKQGRITSIQRGVHTWTTDGKHACLINMSDDEPEEDNVKS